MYHFPEKLALGTLSEFANSVLSKGESVPPLFNGPEMLPSGSDKAKLFAKKRQKLPLS